MGKGSTIYTESTISTITTLRHQDSAPQKLQVLEAWKNSDLIEQGKSSQTDVRLGRREPEQDMGDMRKTHLMLMHTINIKRGCKMERLLP